MLLHIHINNSETKGGGVVESSDNCMLVLSLQILSTLKKPKYSEIKIEQKGKNKKQEKGCILS